MGMCSVPRAAAPSHGCTFRGAVLEAATAAGATRTPAWGAGERVAWADRAAKLKRAIRTHTDRRWRLWRILTEGIEGDCWRELESGRWGGEYVWPCCSGERKPFCSAFSAWCAV